MNEQPSSVTKLLVAERARLTQEIERIDRILAQESGLQGGELPGSGPQAEQDPACSAPTSNLLTKVQALRKVLEVAATPLTPREMVASMQRLGYSFTSTNPANTLNPYLYGAKKLGFLGRFGRGFILASREPEFQQRLSEAAKEPDASGQAPAAP